VECEPRETKPKDPRIPPFRAPDDLRVGSDSNLKILNLMQCANLGGMEQASLGQMQALCRRGHSFQVLSLNPVGALGPLLAAAGIPAEGLIYSGRGGWRTWLPLRRKLKSIPADALLMTGHNLMAQLALGHYCRGRRVLAIHFHHEGVMPARRWRMVYRQACSQFEFITFPSSFIRDEAERIYPPVAAIARTVRYPVTLPPLVAKADRMAGRRLLKLPADAQIIGNAGWLISRKRFDVFLRVAAKVMAVRPEVHAVIAGDGAERASLEQLALSLGIAERVTWTGWLPDMKSFYQSLDLLVFNSDWDALGMTPLEAMSHGIPVVASVVNGGLKEIIASPECGFLLPRHDENLLAAQVLRLLGSAAEATRMGLAGRERIRCVSDPDAIAAEYEQLLGAPAAKPGKRSAAVLFHRLGPYHHSRLRAAGQVLTVNAIELSETDNCYAWDRIEGAEGFARTTLFAEARARTMQVADVTRAVSSALRAIRPGTVAINGWYSAEALSALAWCAETGTPAIMMSESTEWDGPRYPWREWIKRRIVGLCSAGLVGGKPHAAYLAKLGMPPGRIFPGYDVVDNDYFAAGAAIARSQLAEARNRYHLPATYFLASARFVEKKNLPGLIEAYGRYRELASAGRNCPPASDGLWHLVLLGDGPLKPVLLQRISALGLSACVHLPGFAQYPELPAYYGLAGAFIHASTTEQWGLVVNEAMASNLPVLVSQRCGCAEDLVQEGVNGFTFDPFDVQAMAGLMHQLTESPDRLDAMGQASGRIIEGWGPERFGENLGRAVDAAMDSPPPRASRFDIALLRMLARKHGT
jgi:glycosyltransferase involved in cell wall biosynthesis